MIEFLKDNWKLIFEVVVLIASVVIFICRKKPTKLVEGVTDVITRLVPVFINIAEKTDMKGIDKKQYVLLQIRQALIGLGYQEVDAKYIDALASELIEACLSTPQKKGEK